MQLQSSRALGANGRRAHSKLKLCPSVTSPSDVQLRATAARGGIRGPAEPDPARKGPECCGTEVWDRHALAASTLREGQAEDGGE